MNKKGFTLVELLSVIVLIGLLLGIGVPGVMRISKKMKERSFNTKKEQIEQAATLWGQDNRTRLSGAYCKIKEENGVNDYPCYKITIEDLIKNDYLNSENNDDIEYKNPIDNVNMITKCVYVYKKNKRIYAQLDETALKCDNKTMKDIIIENAKSGETNKTKYSETPLTKPADQVGSEEKVLSLSLDDYGASYYFRGNVIDNYVDFANMCWRIVRIEGDGSIKLILEDKNKTCKDSTGNWSIGSGNFGYIEYNNGELTASDGTKNDRKIYAADYLNSSLNNSMAKAFEEFQKTKLKDYIDKLKKENWCLEKLNKGTSVYNHPIDEQNMIDIKVKDKTNGFYYESYMRIYGDMQLNNKSLTPTLKCNGIKVNKFSDGTQMYVGTITADEVVYAGGRLFTTNYPNYYLINNYQKNILRSSFWTLTVSSNYNNIHVDNPNCDLVFMVGHDNVFHYICGNDNSLFRPSIVIKSSLEITSGDGTKENAYVIS